MNLILFFILMGLILFFTLFGFLMRKPDWVIVSGIIFIIIGFNLALTGLTIPI